MGELNDIFEVLNEGIKLLTEHSTSFQIHPQLFYVDYHMTIPKSYGTSSSLLLHASVFTIQSFTLSFISLLKFLLILLNSSKNSYLLSLLLLLFLRCLKSSVYDLTFLLFLIGRSPSISFRFEFVLLHSFVAFRKCCCLSFSSSNSAVVE